VARYEVVREIGNLCSRNQMRDVFFSEVETDDPEAYVRGLLAGDGVTLETTPGAGGSLDIRVSSRGMFQKFLFTPLGE